MANGYKEAKESFVSGMTGSSITHINLISLVALAAVTLYAAMRTRMPSTQAMGFFSSWMVLVLPMLLSMTAAAHKPSYLIGFLTLRSAMLLYTPRTEVGTPLPSNLLASPSSPTVSNARLSNANKMPPLPALTTYRAHMMLMTVLVILAVDFPVFPRSLAKCETFGVSLMDLGVGSFVFSQGIVSAIPLVKDPVYLTSPLIPKLYRVTKKCLPIIALGIVRVLLVKGTEYPEHVTEYGVHWNFFITLALLPIFQVLLHPFLVYLPISMVGVAVALTQHLLLYRFHLKEYVLSDLRSSLISANKEGIVSLPGYFAIHLLGLSVGILVLPPSPSFFRRRQTALSQNQSSKERDDDANSRKHDLAMNLSAPRQTGKTATELGAYAILWWSLLGLARLVRLDGRWGTDGGVSRRMVNVSYILWVAAFNVTFLLLYLCILDMWIFGDPGEAKRSAKAKHHQKDSGPQAQLRAIPEHLEGGAAPVSASTSSLNPPRLLEALNKHSLLVFLLANVLTGVINLSVSTMYMLDVRAMLILSVYSIALCAVPWYMDRRSSKASRT